MWRGHAAQRKHEGQQLQHRLMMAPVDSAARRAASSGTSPNTTAAAAPTTPATDPTTVQANPSTPRPYAHSPLNCTKTRATPAHIPV
jgi:hypothetical protein